LTRPRTITGTAKKRRGGAHTGPGLRRLLDTDGVASDRRNLFDIDGRRGDWEPSPRGAEVDAGALKREREEASGELFHETDEMRRREASARA
jgi:hypothetical protein